MGVFGQYIYGGEAVGGDVYGPDDSIEVDQLGGDVLSLQLDSTAVVDDSFRDITNYTVTVIEGSGDINVRAVVPPTNTLTTDIIYLQVDKPTKGTLYRISVNNLNSITGTTVEGSGLVYARRTKLETVLRSLPNHWDKRPTSTMRNLLTAIAIEDDRIGGSRSDDL